MDFTNNDQDIDVSAVEAEEQIHVTEQEVTELPTKLPSKEIIFLSNKKTRVPRNNLPSKILQSLYLTAFRSSEKGKEKMDDDIRLYHLSISIQSNARDQWIAKELKTHVNNASMQFLTTSERSQNFEA
uniref:Ulp1 protease family, C-terminal catalytic domain containing protein n=1 Tax=Solanum tuberosum TaxID=4113 RepID=M1DW75_SOLTU